MVQMIFFQNISLILLYCKVQMINCCIKVPLLSFFLFRLQHFKECISFIHECRLNGGSCLVHCLAGVSRSTTMVVAYLMTVTHYNRDECLSAVKAVRAFVGPNDGFQRQLLEYQTTQVSEYRTWLRSSFRPSPFNDREQVGALLSQYTEQHESQRRGADRRRANRDGRVFALPADSAYPKGSS